MACANDPVCKLGMQATNTAVTVSPFLRTSSPFTSVANPYDPQLAAQNVAINAQAFPASRVPTGEDYKPSTSSTTIGPLLDKDQKHAHTAIPQASQITAPSAVSIEPAASATDRATLDAPTGYEVSGSILRPELEETPGEIDQENVYLVKNAQLEAVNQKLQHENDILKVEVYETKLALERQTKKGELLQQQLNEAENALRQKETHVGQHDGGELSKNGEVRVDRLTLRLQKAERALEQERQATQNVKKQLELALGHRVTSSSNGGAMPLGETSSSHGHATEEGATSCTSGRSTPQASMPIIFEDSQELRAELQAVQSQLLVRTVDVERLRKLHADAEDTVQHLRDQLVGLMQASKLTIEEEEVLKQRLKTMEQENKQLATQEAEWRLKARATDDRAKAYDAVGCDLQRKCEAASATVGRLIEDNSELVNKLNSQSNLVAELQKEVRLQAAGIRTLEQLLMSYRSGGSTHPTMMPALSALDSEQEDQWKLSMLREEVEKLEIEVKAERSARQKLERQLGTSGRAILPEEQKGENVAKEQSREGSEMEGTSGVSTQAPVRDQEPESPFHPPCAEPGSARLEHTESVEDLSRHMSPGSQIHALARKLFILDEELESERLQIRLISAQLQGGGEAGPAAAQLKAVQDAISVGQGLPSLPPVAGPLAGRPYSTAAAAPPVYSSLAGQGDQLHAGPTVPAASAFDMLDDFSSLDKHTGTAQKKQRVGFWSWLTGAGSKVEVLPF